MWILLPLPKWFHSLLFGQWNHVHSPWGNFVIGDNSCSKIPPINIFHCHLGFQFQTRELNIEFFKTSKQRITSFYTDMFILQVMFWIQSNITQLSNNRKENKILIFMSTNGQIAIGTSFHNFSSLDSLHMIALKEHKQNIVVVIKSRHDHTNVTKFLSLLTQFLNVKI